MIWITHWNGKSYIDIHHFHTCRGNATFFILPYGTIGHDISSEVIAVGEALKIWLPGDKGYYFLIFGGPGSYEEYRLTNEPSLSKMPDDLSYLEAAAVQLAGSTVWEILVLRAKL